MTLPTCVRWTEGTAFTSTKGALAQIKEKDYAAPYRVRNVSIWVIGLNFDSKTRGLTDAVHERLA